MENQSSIINDAVKLQNQYENIPGDGEIQQQNQLQEKANEFEKYSKYLYPTLITLPLIIVLILIVASTAQMGIKIFAIILVLISLIAYYGYSQNINILQYIKKKE